MLGAWFSLAAVFVAALVIYLFFYTRWRRQRVERRPFPADWQTLLNNNMGLYRQLPEPLRQRLHQRIQVFLDEKRFYGCNGLQISEPMKVLIAAHACLLILNRSMSHYDRLRSILVYPGAYRSRQQIYEISGIQSQQMSTRLGESWENGRVILSWADVVEDAQGLRPRGNVSLHEFSHQLDQVNGSADGLPVLAPQQSLAEWSQVFGQEFAQLQQDVLLHHPTVIDAYGAQSPAEFFAVVSEAFFTDPVALKAEHPALYDQLQAFYCLDPIHWAETPTDPLH